MNAVGSRWMNAVAMSTPVPKCRERKRNRCGIGSFGKRRAITGKEHADCGQSRLPVDLEFVLPSVLNIRMRNNANTCAAVL